MLEIYSGEAVSIRNRDEVGWDRLVRDLFQAWSQTSEAAQGEENGGVGDEECAQERRQGTEQGRHGLRPQPPPGERQQPHLAVRVRKRVHPTWGAQGGASKRCLHPFSRFWIRLHTPTSPPNPTSLPSNHPSARSLYTPHYLLPPATTTIHLQTTPTIPSHPFAIHY